MARTMPGASAWVYVLALAVWWMKAILTGAYDGEPVRRRSSAPHSERVTMAGVEDAADAASVEPMLAMVAATRRTAPVTRSARLPSEVGSMATTRTPVSAAGPRAPPSALTCR